MGRTFASDTPRRAAPIRRGTVALGALVILIAWAVTGLSILDAHRAAVDQARSGAGNLAAAFANEDRYIIDDVARAMDALAARMRTADATRDLFDDVREAQQLQPNDVRVGIIGPDGRLRATSIDRRAGPIDLSDREHFRIHLDRRFEGIFVGKPVTGRISGQVLIPLTRRVDADDGTFLGVIAFAFPPTAFTSLQSLVDLGPRDVIVLTGLDNVIIARFTRDHPEGVFAVGQSVAGGTRPSGLAEGAHGHYVKKGAVDGIERILAYRRVAGYPVVVTVGLALDDALAPVYRHALMIGGFTLAATVLLVALGIFLLRENARRTKNELLLAEEQAKLEAANSRLEADNAARVEAEQRARDSESRFRSYAEAASDWFWETGPDGRFTFISERFGEVAGVAVADLLGRPHVDLRHDAEDAISWRAHLDAFANRRPYRDFACRVFRPNGDVRHIRVSGTPVFSAGGTFLGYRGAGRDVTAEGEAQIEKERVEQRLHESIEALGEGFALFDADERLVLCNTRYRELYPWIGDLIVPGVRFEELVRAGAQRRGVELMTGDAETWIAERLRMFRDTDGPSEERLEHGRWYQRGNYRTASGGTICLRTDITDVKRMEQTLHDAIESMSEGFALFDANEGLVLSNAHFREIYRMGPDLAAPGTPLETILRRNVARGMHPAAIGDEESWIAARLQAFRSLRGPTEQMLNDGRWLRVTDARTPSGGTICLRADITALKNAETRLLESVEALAEGFALFDPDEKLVLCNSRFREIHAWNRELFVPGVRFEDIVRNTARMGLVTEAVDRVEEFVAERLEQFRNPTRPFDRCQADGRWIRYTDYRSPSGHTICLRSDITDIKGVEQRLRDAINSIPDGFALYDPQDRLILCNHRFRDIYTYLKDGADLTGRSFDELTRPLVEREMLWPDGYDPQEWFAARMEAHRRTPDEPFLLHLKDGRWIEVNERRTLEGGWVSVCVDITARKNFEGALRDSEMTLRSILAASPDPLLVLDERHCIMLASERAGAVFGYDRSELIGMPAEMLVPERFRAGHATKVSDYIDNPYPREMGTGLDIWALRKDGTEFPVEIALNPCRTTDGLVTLAAIRDLTLRRKMEDALRDAQKMEALGTLAGGIAHDLNNTLVPILGLTQILMEGMAADAAERELLDDVLSSADRAKDLVAQILAFSRSETVELRPINLGDAVADALRLVRAAIPPMIDIRIDITPEPLTIRGSETQVHQVVFNLCTNAAHAIGARSGKIDVRLSGEELDEQTAFSLSLPAGRYACLTIADDGRGMDEGTRRRIFEPFFTTKEVGEGTGLGMSIVHGVIAAYHGKINVTSQAGKGTRIEIYIPLASNNSKNTSNKINDISSDASQH